MDGPRLLESYTVADYEAWEGDWELIHGQPLAMTPSPGIRHQQVAMGCARSLDEALDECPECQVLYEIDVELGEETVVRPDLVVVCFPAEGDRLTRAPELIVEVVSHQRARRDEVIKFDLYRREGVSHFVLAYPEARKAKVYRLVEGDYRKAGDFHDESHRFELARCTFDLDFSQLWRR